jgi:hypothetical protein
MFHRAAHRALYGVAAGVAFVLLAAAAGCQDNTSTAKGFTSYSQPHAVTFIAYDHNATPLAGAKVFLDNAVTPTATSNSAGAVTLQLTGIHDVHFVMPGYSARSYIHRDWTAVTATQSLRLAINLGTSTTAAINGSIAPTTAGDVPYRAKAVRQDDGFSFTSAIITPAASTTPYATVGFLGTNEVFLYPSSVNSSGGQAYAAYATPFSLTGGGATKNLTPTLGGGVTFNMSGSNGIVAGGSMNSSYAVFRDPLGVSTLIANGSVFQPGAGLAGDTLTVPPIESVYPGADYALSVNSQTNAINTRQSRAWLEIYGSFASLSAAPATQSFTLPDFGVGIVGPTDASINQGTFPTFTWTLTGSPGFTEIFISKRNCTH